MRLRLRWWWWGWWWWFCATVSSLTIVKYRRLVAVVEDILSLTSVVIALIRDFWARKGIGHASVRSDFKPCHFCGAKTQHFIAGWSLSRIEQVSVDPIAACVTTGSLLTWCSVVVGCASERWPPRLFSTWDRGSTFTASLRTLFRHRWVTVEVFSGDTPTWTAPLNKTPFLIR